MSVADEMMDRQCLVCLSVLDSRPFLYCPDFLEDRLEWN